MAHGEEHPRPTMWELDQDGEIVETRRFDDGSEIKVHPIDGGEDGILLGSLDVMRTLGFSEDIVQLYAERWGHSEQDESAGQ
jgi:hypothetical protein